MPSSHFSESKNIAAEATENIRHSADAHYWTTAVFKFLHSPVWRNTLWHLFAISEFICFRIMQMPPVISSCNWGVRFLLITQSSRGRCHQFFLFGRRKKMCAPLYTTRQQKLLHLQLAGFLTKNFWTCPGQQTKCLYSMEHVAYKQLLTCWEVLFLWNVQKNSSEKEKGFSLRYLLQRQEHNHIPWSQSSKVWEEAFIKCQRSLQSKQLLANAHLIGGAHFILTSYRTSELLKHKVIPVSSLWD